MNGEQTEGDPSSASSIEIALDIDESGTPRAAWAQLPAPALTFSRYGIVGRLAVGGMAEIFLAQDFMPGGAARHLVIKVLRVGPGFSAPEDEGYFESMFLREGYVAMQLTHPNICSTYEFGKWGGHYFIAMEWVEGLSVRALLQRLGRAGRHVPIDVAVYLIAQVAGALEYAHHARDADRRPLGVVHRDVSPHNIMLRYDGVVKLLDFGVAKVETSEEHSEAGSLKGKFGYMAPEQCVGSPLDLRADVFALGVCLFEMLTGERLYQRGSQYETCRAIVEEPPPSVRERRPEVAEELDAILQRALAKLPDERFDTAGDLEEALVKFASRQGYLMSATPARRWVEELYGEALYDGPRLEVDEVVMRRLSPLVEHVPLSTSVAPPPMTPPAPTTQEDRVVVATAARTAPVRTSPTSASRGIDTIDSGSRSVPGRSTRGRLASSAFARRLSTHMADPRSRNRWLALGLAAACVVGAWAWWLVGHGDMPSVTPRPTQAAQPVTPSDEGPQVRPAQAPGTQRDEGANAP